MEHELRIMAVHLVCALLNVDAVVPHDPHACLPRLATYLNGLAFDSSAGRITNANRELMAMQRHGVSKPSWQ